jgi:hypothetical protein
MARFKLVRLTDGKPLDAHGGVWTGAARHSTCG